MYKCHACGKQFLGTIRLDPSAIWQQYVHGKQTYRQLSLELGCSVKTIQRYIDRHKVIQEPPVGQPVILLMDTTYWGRNFGVMLFRDALTRQNLLKYYVRHETNTLYAKGVNELKGKGFGILAIVCDGRRGLIQSFGEVPVQMCQFHQSAIIRRYLTKRPKLEAARELLGVVDLMKQTDKESFVGALGDWFTKWENFLDERTINTQTGKTTFYTHKRLRSAYRSLETNLPWLFTWYDNIGLKIPNTTNAIDGHFADLKNKLRNHNGLSIKRKTKFIDEFLKV